VKSTGNDIVALQAINRERTNRFRFYSKILCVSEQALYDRQEFAELPFEEFVWLLWSIKESAYKYLKRIVPDLVFSPTKLIIDRIDAPNRSTITNFGCIQKENNNNEPGEDFYKSVITFGSFVLHSRSLIHNELISTVVCNKVNFENIWWGIKSIDTPNYEHQSKSVREFVLNRLNSFLPGFHDHLQIGKNRMGCPVVLNEAGEINIPVSLAHDHHFIAYSFLLKHP